MTARTRLAIEQLVRETVVASHFRETVADQTPDMCVASFDRLLRSRGLHAALEFLNARTRFRYTGVYQFAPPLLANVSLFDRENPSIRSRSPLVLRETYCAIVESTGDIFVTENSLEDERLVAHPARLSVLAYHAIPLRDTVDKCIGSLCHWDTRPRVLEAGEEELMFAAAPSISREVVRLRRQAHRPSEGRRLSP